MMWCLGFVLVVAFSLLAMAMPKHQRDFFVNVIGPRQTLWLKIVGWGLLIGSMLKAVNVWGLTHGLSQWVISLTFAALVVALISTYIPKKYRYVVLWREY